MWCRLSNLLFASHAPSSPMVTMALLCILCAFLEGCPKLNPAWSSVAYESVGLYSFSLLGDVLWNGHCANRGMLSVPTLDILVDGVISESVNSCDISEFPA